MEGIVRKKEGSFMLSIGWFVFTITSNLLFLRSRGLSLISLGCGMPTGLVMSIILSKVGIFPICKASRVLLTILHSTNLGVPLITGSLLFTTSHTLSSHFWVTIISLPLYILLNNMLGTLVLLHTVLHLMVSLLFLFFFGGYKAFCGLWVALIIGSIPIYLTLKGGQLQRYNTTRRAREDQFLHGEEPQGDLPHPQADITALREELHSQHNIDYALKAMIIGGPIGIGIYLGLSGKYVPALVFSCIQLLLLLIFILGQKNGIMARLLRIYIYAFFDLLKRSRGLLILGAILGFLIYAWSAVGMLNISQTYALGGLSKLHFHVTSCQIHILHDDTVGLQSIYLEAQYKGTFADQLHRQELTINLTSKLKHIEGCYAHIFVNPNGMLMQHGLPSLLEADRPHISFDCIKECTLINKGRMEMGNRRLELHSKSGEFHVHMREVSAQIVDIDIFHGDIIIHSLLLNASAEQPSKISTSRGSIQITTPSHLTTSNLDSITREEKESGEFNLKGNPDIGNERQYLNIRAPEGEVRVRGWEPRNGSVQYVGSMSERESIRITEEENDTENPLAFSGASGYHINYVKGDFENEGKVDNAIIVETRHPDLESSDYMKWVITSNRAYFQLRPWTFAILTLGLTQSAPYRIRPTLINGPCPLPLTYDYNTLGALYHLINRTFYDHKMVPDIVLISEHPIAPYTRLLQGFYQQWGDHHGALNPINENWYYFGPKLVSPRLTKNIFLLGALIFSIIVGILVAIFGFINLLPMLYIAMRNICVKNSQYESYKHIQKLAEKRKTAKWEEDLELDTSQEDNPEGKRAIYRAPKTLIENLKGIFRVGISPFELIEHMLYKIIAPLFINSMDEFLMLIPDLPNNPIDDRKTKPFSLIKLRELYEQFCFIRSLREKPILPAAKKFAHKGLEIYLKKTEMYTNLVLKYEYACEDSPKLADEDSLDCFLRIRCILTDFDQDKVTTSKFQKCYSKFCKQKFIKEEREIDVKASLEERGVSIELSDAQYIRSKNPLFQISKVREQMEEMWTFLLNKNNSGSFEKAKEFSELYYANVPKKVNDKHHILRIIMVTLHIIITSLLCFPFTLLLVMGHIFYYPFAIINQQSIISQYDVVYFPWRIISKLLGESNETHYLLILCIILFFLILHISQIGSHYFIFSWHPISTHLLFPPGMSTNEKKSSNLAFWVEHVFQWLVIIISAATLIIYIVLVVEWWVLLALINPTCFLPFASGIGAGIGYGSSKLKALKQERAKGRSAIEAALAVATSAAVVGLVQKTIQVSNKFLIYKRKEGLREEGEKEEEEENYRRMQKRERSLAKMASGAGFEYIQLMKVLDGDHYSIKEFSCTYNLPVCIIYTLLAIVKKDPIEQKKQTGKMGKKLHLSPIVIDLVLDLCFTPRKCLKVERYTQILTRYLFQEHLYKDKKDNLKGYIDLIENLYPQLVGVLSRLEDDGVSKVLNTFTYLNTSFRERARMLLGILPTTFRKGGGRYETLREDPQLHVDPIKGAKNIGIKKNFANILDLLKFVYARKLTKDDIQNGKMVIIHSFSKANKLPKEISYLLDIIFSNKEIILTAEEELINYNKISDIANYLKVHPLILFLLLQLHSSMDTNSLPDDFISHFSTLLPQIPLPINVLLQLRNQFLGKKLLPNLIRTGNMKGIEKSACELITYLILGSKKPSAKVMNGLYQNDLLTRIMGNQEKGTRNKIMGLICFMLKTTKHFTCLPFLAYLCQTNDILSDPKDIQTLFNVFILKYSRDYEEIIEVIKELEIPLGLLAILSKGLVDLSAIKEELKGECYISDKLLKTGYGIGIHEHEEWEKLINDVAKEVPMKISYPLTQPQLKYVDILSKTELDTRDKLMKKKAAAAKEAKTKIPDDENYKTERTMHFVNLLHLGPQRFIQDGLFWLLEPLSCYKGCEQLQKKKGKLLDCLMDFNKGETGIVIKDISTLSGLSQESISQFVKLGRATNDGQLKQAILEIILQADPQLIDIEDQLIEYIDQSVVQINNLLNTDYVIGELEHKLEIPRGILSNLLPLELTERERSLSTQLDIICMSGLKEEVEKLSGRSLSEYTIFQAIRGLKVKESLPFKNLLMGKELIPILEAETCILPVIAQKLNLPIELPNLLISIGAILGKYGETFKFPINGELTTSADYLTHLFEIDNPYLMKGFESLVAGDFNSVIKYLSKLAKCNNLKEKSIRGLLSLMIGKKKDLHLLTNKTGIDNELLVSCVLFQKLGKSSNKREYICKMKKEKSLIAIFERLGIPFEHFIGIVKCSYGLNTEHELEELADSLLLPQIDCDREFIKGLHYVCKGSLIPLHGELAKHQAKILFTKCEYYFHRLGISPTLGAFATGFFQSNFEVFDILADQIGVDISELKGYLWSFKQLFVPDPFHTQMHINAIKEGLIEQTHQAISLYYKTTILHLWSDALNHLFRFDIQFANLAKLLDIWRDFCEKIKPDDSTFLVFARMILLLEEININEEAFASALKMNGLEEYKYIKNIEDLYTYFIELISKSTKNKYEKSDISQLLHLSSRKSISPLLFLTYMESQMRKCPRGFTLTYVLGNLCLFSYRNILEGRRSSTESEEQPLHFSEEMRESIYTLLGMLTGERIIYAHKKISNLAPFLFLPPSILQKEEKTIFNLLTIGNTPMPYESLTAEYKGPARILTLESYQSYTFEAIRNKSMLITQKRQGKRIKEEIIVPLLQLTDTIDRESSSENLMDYKLLGIFAKGKEITYSLHLKKHQQTISVNQKEHHNYLGMMGILNMYKIDEYLQFAGDRMCLGSECVTNLSTLWNPKRDSEGNQLGNWSPSVGDLLNCLVGVIHGSLDEDILKYIAYDFNLSTEQLCSLMLTDVYHYALQINKGVNNKIREIRGIVEKKIGALCSVLVEDGRGEKELEDIACIMGACIGCEESWLKLAESFSTGDITRSFFAIFNWKSFSIFRGRGIMDNNGFRFNMQENLRMEWGRFTAVVEEIPTLLDAVLNKGRANENISENVDNIGDNIRLLTKVGIYPICGLSFLLLEELGPLAPSLQLNLPSLEAYFLLSHSTQTTLTNLMHHMQSKLITLPTPNSSTFIDPLTIFLQQKSRIRNSLPDTLAGNILLNLGLEVDQINTNILSDALHLYIHLTFLALGELLDTPHFQMMHPQQTLILNAAPLLQHQNVRSLTILFALLNKENNLHNLQLLEQLHNGGDIPQLFRGFYFFSSYIMGDSDQILLQLPLHLKEKELKCLKCIAKWKYMGAQEVDKLWRAAPYSKRSMEMEDLQKAFISKIQILDAEEEFAEVPLETIESPELQKKDQKFLESSMAPLFNSAAPYLILALKHNKCLDEAVIMKFENLVKQLLSALSSEGEKDSLKVFRELASGIIGKVSEELFGFLPKDRMEIMSTSVRRQHILTAFHKLFIPNLLPYSHTLFALLDILRVLDLVIRKGNATKENINQISEAIGITFGIPSYLISSLYYIGQGNLEKGKNAILYISSYNADTLRKLEILLKKIIQERAKEEDKRRIIMEQERQKGVKKEFEKLMAKEQENTSPDDLFQLLDLEGDQSGGISIDEFEVLSLRMNKRLTNHRIIEIYSGVKVMRIPNPNKQNELNDDELHEKEFERALEYFDKIKAEKKLENRQLDIPTMVRKFLIIIIIIILLISFLFLGIKAFSVKGTMGSIITSAMPLGAALGAQKSKNGGKSDLKEDTADSDEEGDEDDVEEDD